MAERPGTLDLTGTSGSSPGDPARSVPRGRTAGPDEAAGSPAGRSKHLSPAERSALGRAARRAVPRAAHSQLNDESGRPDPVDLLQSQGEPREPDLIPIRHGRMAGSAFAFYRGAALPMAADLAGTPTSGLRTQICGDAHLLNFGIYASPDRRLVFDLNDFDETLPGPWEWDVKRLATSIEVAGRDRNFSRKERSAAVLAALARYRTAMREFAGMTTLAVWYSRLEADEILRQLQSGARSSKDAHVVRTGKQVVTKAATRSNLQAVSALTHEVDGRLQFTSNPPIVERLTDLLPSDQRHRLENGLTELLQGYADTLSPDRRGLLAAFEVVDMARKVVGVGSVGTRCWILLLLGRGSDDPLILQAKEAEASVLERFLEPSTVPNHGERVVAGQRLMQATSDIFLGWDRLTGIDGRLRDFYLRQLRDGKGSMDITRMVPAGLKAYAELCGWTLARGHARSGDPIAITAYLGSSDAFDVAVATFADRYADRNERDHAGFVRAISKGRLPAVTGV